MRAPWSMMLPAAVLALVLAIPAGAAMEQFFPDADRVAEPAGEPPVSAVYRGEEQVGVIFETNDVAPIPAYSGEPVNMLVGLDMDGVVTGVRVLEHSEPIMLVGIPEARLVDFVDQYVKRTIRERVRVGLSPRKREGYRGGDGRGHNAQCPPGGDCARRGGSRCVADHRAGQRAR
jgi:NosR/NirI family transcriptional regulator, nitrous oxide reductase regulator